MGRLIKNHWGRLIILTAAAYQVVSAIEGFIWPKVFWDFISRNLDAAVAPVPVLQILNLIMGLVGIAWEWPLKPLAGSIPHRSIEIRLLVYPLSALLAALLYQGTDPAIYYLIGIGVYFWAYSEGEMPPSTGTQPKVEVDEVVLETVEDVPVNKITSFNGKLQQYLHSGTTAHDGPTASRTTISQQRINTTKTEPQAEAIVSSPRRKRTVPQTTESATTTTCTRTSRSQSILPTTPPSPNKRKRRTATPKTPPTPPIAGPSATESLLRDTIPANLILLLVGVNPGIMTGITGYAYAHPSNLFWKLLFSSGITSIRHIPADTYKLPALYSVGNTNIVERPTRDASMLSRAEMDAGVPVLEAKIAAQRPEAVCLVGKGIWEAVWRVRHGRGIRKEEFRYGWQVEAENMGRCDGWAGAPVFVATTTSGLAAGMKPAEKEAVWAELGSWVVKRRGERGLGSVVIKAEV
ncbi:DNA glycosylase, G/T mismatch [Penicillium italicum]|uniref:DNA glycosylase, G/T mismatch n=1 Tax=Penicillium italicum TaxID=40296 RepID=A0A0A2L2I0_PENIT|nr:DNA glycosylase, G/T mismatch [Penicillium italicum]